MNLLFSKHLWSTKNSKCSEQSESGARKNSKVRYFNLFLGHKISQNWNERLAPYSLLCHNYLCVAGLSTYQLSYLNLSFTNNLQNQAYHGILAEYMRLIPTCEKNQYGVRGARYPVSKKSLFWAFFGVFIISSLKTWRVLSQKVLNMSQLNYNFSAWIRSISRFVSQPQHKPT